MGLHLIGIHLTGIYLMDGVPRKRASHGCISMYLISVHLIGVCL
jgi:hypothetical protein